MQITSIIDTLPVLQISSVAENSCACQAQGCQPCAAIAVTGIICAAVLIIAIVALVLYYKLKTKESMSQMETSKSKWEHENAERTAKQEAEKTKRAWDVEDTLKKKEQEIQKQERERREHLIDEYLCFMEELTKKETPSETDMNYMNELKQFINEFPKSK